jgi:hypothetical protein
MTDAAAALRARLKELLATKTPTPAAPSAPATPIAATSEPQHPPCTIDFHQSGKGCGWMLCSICNDEYHLGLKWQGPSGWHYFPEAEHAYWAHTLGEHHIAVNEARVRATLYVLAALPEALKAGKQYQKRNADPAMRALRKLLN